MLQWHNDFKIALDDCKEHMYLDIKFQIWRLPRGTIAANMGGILDPMELSRHIARRQHELWPHINIWLYMTIGIPVKVFINR